MKTIAIISQKGGAGKTTLAVNFAVEAERRRKSTLLIDLDPQASAMGWGDSREDDTPVVESAQAAALPKLLKTAQEHDADLVVIDTAPHSEQAAIAAARAADIVLIPCRPGILDIRAIQASLDVCALAKCDAVVVLNALPPQESIKEDAEAAIKEIGGRVLTAGMGNRVAYSHAMNAGLGVVEFEPSGKAAAEVQKLFKTIWKEVK